MTEQLNSELHQTQEPAAPEQEQRDTAEPSDTPQETLEKNLEEARADAERYRDQLLRKAAEFDNYKRRTEGEWQNFQRLANERLLLSFLTILDDLSRSLKSSGEQKSFDALYQGIELIRNKFLQTLKANGVEPIESVGKPFNVDEHDALLQVPRADLPPHTVIEEVERGYRFYDRVLRHAKVVVSGDVPGEVTPPGGTIDVKA